MRLIGINVILLSLLSCQSTDPARSAIEQRGSNGQEAAPVWPQNGLLPLPKTLRQRPSETLEGNEIGRWKQVAMDAATFAEAWSHLGGERLIEGPYKLDSAQMTYSMLGKDCDLRGSELFVKNNAACDRIKVVIPTDQQSACALFLIEVLIARESGQVIDMKDSFVESNSLNPVIFKKEKTKYGCLTRRIDAPIRDESSLIPSLAATERAVESSLMRAYPLYAMYLYVRELPALSTKLMEVGHSKEVAERLVFRITESTAFCLIQRLARAEQPRVQIFLKLLGLENEYSDVTVKLRGRHSESELNELCTVVNDVTADCHKEAMDKWVVG